jgi:hypothetical protein
LNSIHLDIIAVIGLQRGREGAWMVPRVEKNKNNKGAYQQRDRSKSKKEKRNSDKQEPKAKTEREKITNNDSI